MTLYRSMLFVPGHKSSWVDKAIESSVDLIILDLEDSVPTNFKELARSTVAENIIKLKSLNVPCFVRINGFDSELTHDDLAAVVSKDLTGVILPKIEFKEDVNEIDILLKDFEIKRGLLINSIQTPLFLETAAAMKNAYEIALSCSRIRSLSLAAGPGGDSNRSIGYVWSKEGYETLFLRSKAVLDSQAAGFKYPTISSWWDIKDLEGLEKDARLNRQLGFRGMVLIHPSHVRIVNKIFSPTTDELDYYKEMIDLFEQAEEKGNAAVVYKGDMIDYAMYNTAKEFIENTKLLKGTN